MWPSVGIHELELPPCDFENRWNKISGYRRRLISTSDPLRGLRSCIIDGMHLTLCILPQKQKEGTTKLPIRSLLSKFAYHSILKATNWFPSKNLIKSGTFGAVHKAIRNQRSRIAPIKVVNLAHSGGSKRFISGSTVLMNILKSTQGCDTFKC